MDDSIQSHSTADGRTIFILRGDMIKGGLKKLALLRYLPTLNHTHFAYAGSVFGSGAWALSEACAVLGFHCSLFMSQSKIVPPWLNAVERTGAQMTICDSLPVETLHNNISQNHPNLHNLPLGFDTRDFITAMADVLREQCPVAPPEIWVSALSGVLARAACDAFPHSTVHAVSAVKYVGECGRATLHLAPEKFHYPAENLPPYPACPYSCAKVWQITEKQAVSGALIINIGY